MWYQMDLLLGPKLAYMGANFTFNCFLYVSYTSFHMPVYIQTYKACLIMPQQNHNYNLKSIFFLVVQIFSV